MKKKEEKPCCGENCDSDTMIKSEGASVKILGSGCKKCNELELNTIEALKQLDMDTSVDHVKDFAQIAAYGVMSTPALVFNGKVVSYGKVLKTNEIINILKKEMG
jgi:small redox-active disulfide protein 2